MEKKINIELIVILAILSFSLIAAYVIEYGLGHAPCKLCIYQRVPYLFSIFLILNILLAKKYIKLSLLFLAIFSLCGSALAFYHFGIEQGFFSETLVCETGNQINILSKEELLDQLKKQTVSCKEVTFKVFGLSLASINTIFSFILFCIFVSLYKNYEINK